MANIDYLRSASGILKIFEMVFVIVAFGVLRGTEVGAFNLDAFYFGVGVMFSCMLVTPLLLVCYLMGKMEIQQTILEFAFNSIFFFFLTIYGVMGMIDYSKWGHGAERDSGIAMCFFTLCAATTYLLDAVMAVINFKK